MAESETAPVADIAPVESAPAPIQAAPEVASQPVKVDEPAGWREEREQMQQKLARMEAYAQLGARYLQEQQRQPEPAPKPAEPDKPWYADRYQEPEFKQYFTDYLTVDERGQQTFVENTPPEIQREYREYQAAVARNLKEFGKNPYQFGEAYIERARELAKQDAAEIVREQFEAYRTEQRVQALEQQHESWLYVTDDSGRVQRDPQTGQKIPSQLGILAKQCADFAALPQDQGGLGIPTIEGRWQYVMAQVEAHVYRTQLQQGQAQPGQPAPAQPTAAAPVADPATEQKVALLERGRKQASRSPSRASSPAAPAQKKSFRDTFREQLATDGVLN